jgi:RimJ/RimL family protein N-acetyltransferase
MSVVALTPRLVLRHWEYGDAGATHHIYGDDEAMRYFASGRAFTREELIASFPRLIEEYATVGYGNYAVVERATNRILGHCGARYVPGLDWVEADWALERQSWGRGYGTEAAQAVFARAFSVDGVARIVAIAHEDNLASIALMRRLGMQFCEELEARGMPSVMYAIEREAFTLPPEVLAEISILPA